LMADGLECIEDGLVGCFGAARASCRSGCGRRPRRRKRTPCGGGGEKVFGRVCFLANWSQNFYEVDDVAAASADPLLSSEWFERRKPQTEELALINCIMGTFGLRF